jgi:hypothetical protein
VSMLAACFFGLGAAVPPGARGGGAPAEPRPHNGREPRLIQLLMKVSYPIR